VLLIGWIVLLLLGLCALGLVNWRQFLDQPSTEPVEVEAKDE
jgi:hypothetical protein